ncbi:MAG: MBL fold metallo-hydrolase [Candidatus ainarchaeum sp.]|nr:MBL fold metallo-hydrolase [Candidatus ainarchaeum sp.]
MKLRFLGAAREVGRSGVLLDAGKRILFDYGMKVGEKNEFPLQAPSGIDAVVLSHAHLDHTGSSPALYEKANPPCFLTPPTADLASLLLKDSLKVCRLKGERAPFSQFHLKKMERAVIPLGYGRQFPLSRDSSLTFFDAGHVPGSAIAQVYSQHKRIVYTGDFKMEATRMHRGAEPVENCDVLVIESTYEDHDHPDRPKLEKRIAEEARETMDGGGSVLFPAFAVGRSQELLMLVDDLLPGAQAYIDGMSKTATEIAAAHPQYLRNAKALRKAMRDAEWVETDGQRRKAAEEPSVIISSAGMLEGGPALTYLLKLNERSKIILTGYQVEGTNARSLLEKKRVVIDNSQYEVTIPTEYLDMSAHAGRSDLLAFVKRANPEKVFCIHGDKCEEFAEALRGMGFDAKAPRLGDSFEL